MPLLPHKLRVADPGYRPLTEAELDQFDKNPEIEIDPEWAEVGQLIWAAIHPHDKVMDGWQNQRLSRNLKNSQVYCDDRKRQFVNTEQESLDVLQKERRVLANSDHRIKMHIVDELVSNARKALMEFTNDFYTSDPAIKRW